MAISVILKKPDEEPVYLQVKASKLTLGRSRSCNHPISDILVSGRHCEFYLSDGKQLAVRDLGSTNGTFINDLKLVDSLVYIDDKIFIGNYEACIDVKKLTNKERLLHTRSEPRTQLTYISFEHSKPMNSKVVSKSDIYNVDENAINDPESLRNRKATTLFQLEKKKKAFEKKAAKEKKKENKSADKKEGLLSKILSKFTS